MEDFILPDDVFAKISLQTNKSSTPDEFLSVFEATKSNPVLTRILSLWADEQEREEQIKKLTYARILFNDEIYNTLWEDNIQSLSMTLDKLRVIAKGDVEYDVGGLPLPLIRAMTGEYLAHEWMTTSKLSVLRASPEAIRELWPQPIAEMTKEEMENALRVWETK